MIMGLDRPDSGSVTVNGRPYHGLAWPLREVGALLEAKAIHPGRSAYAHLWMLAKTNRIPRRRVDEVLGLVGLSSVAGKRAGEFSLGMGQRLGIAAALLGDPGVLMFDEPVNGLDTDGIRWVRQLLRRLAAEGRTVFVSSHLMSEMAQTADQLVVIGRGRLIAEMPVAEFTSRYSQGYVRVRSPQLHELRVALEEAGGLGVVRGGGPLHLGAGTEPGQHRRDRLPALDHAPRAGAPSRLAGGGLHGVHRGRRRVRGRPQHAVTGTAREEEHDDRNASVSTLGDPPSGHYGWAACSRRSGPSSPASAPPSGPWWSPPSPAWASVPW